MTDQKISTEALKISTGAFGIPKKSSDNNYFNYGSQKKCCKPVRGSSPKPDECGEDSYFIKDTEDKVWIGVADGVSEAAECGMDPANFSRALMRHSSDLIDPKFKISNPKTILQLAFFRLVDECITKGVNNSGASTACLVMIEKCDGKVKFANLGDSGFVILSPSEDGKYKIKERTKPLQMYFNCPFQYSLRSADDYADSSEKIDTRIRRTLTVMSGDIVLVMTDGVPDNVYDHELEEIVTETLKESKDDARALAEEIAFKAFEFSTDKERICPFEIESLRERDYYFKGGKKDDITVIAAIIN